MVSATLSTFPEISERSEKNTSCWMLRAARSPRIISIIMAIDRSRTPGSHSDSGWSSNRSPYWAASACPTGTR